MDPWSDGRLLGSSNEVHRHDTADGNHPVPTLPDYALQVGFVGGAIAFVGTVSIVFALMMCTADDCVRWGSFGGSFCVTLGTALYTLAQLVFGSVSTTLGGVLLFFGMGLFSSALFVVGILGDAAADQEDALPALQVGALVIVLVAVLLMCHRGFTQMRYPFLGPRNYFFHGTAVYAIGAVMYIVPIVWDLADVQGHLNVNVGSVAALCLSVGALLMMLAGSRGALNLDATLSDRYPSTTLLHIDLSQALLALRSSNTLVVGRLWTVVVGLLAHFDESWAVVAAGDFIVGVGAAALACSMVKGLHRIGTESATTIFDVRDRILCVSALGGCVLFSLAAWCRSAAKVALSIDSEQEYSLVGVASGVCAVSQFTVGASVIMLGFWVNPPIHPGNYFVVASVVSGVGDVLEALGALGAGEDRRSGTGTDLEHVGGALSLLGAILFPLHAAMALETATTAMYQGKCLDDRVPEIQEESEPWPEMEHVPLKEVEVLICGGGPVGLTLASNLGLLGIKVLLVEERESVIGDARFFILNMQTMEYFDRLGVAEEIERHGVAQDIPFGCVWANGLSQPNSRIIGSACTPGRQYCKSNISDLDHITASRLVASPHASCVPQRIMQSKQEMIMKASAESRGSVEVLYGCSLRRFREVQPVDGEGFVEAFVENVSVAKLDKQQEGIDVLSCDQESKINGIMVRAKYLAGCDGPGGPVAKQLKFKYDGFANVTKTTSYLVKSLELSRQVLAKLGASNQYQISRPGVGYGLCTHVEPDEGLWNFIGSWFYKPELWSSKPADLIIREFMGPMDYELLSQKSWYWNFFIARSFRRRRILLCGDAAHSWPPVCGLGGNTGYADACDLSWKLAAVLRGWGGDLLLESYGMERRNSCLRAAQCVMSCMPRPPLVMMLCRAWELFGWIPLVTRILKWKWSFGNSGPHYAQHHGTAGVQLGTRQDFSPVCMTESIIPPDDPWTVYTQRVVAGGRLPVALLSSGQIQHVLCRTGYTLLAPRMTLAAVEALVRQEEPFATETRSEQSDGSVQSIFSTQAELAVATESLKCLVSAFHALSAPLTVLGLRKGEHALVSKGLSGSRLEAYKLFRGEAFILVRPDCIVAWHLSHRRFGRCLSPEMAVEIARTVTGRGSSLVDEKVHRVHSSLGWLTSRFLFSLRPFKYNFPNALALENETKDEAIVKLRKMAGKDFQTTTKYEDAPPKSEEKRRADDDEPTIKDLDEVEIPDERPGFRSVKDAKVPDLEVHEFPMIAACDRAVQEQDFVDVAEREVSELETNASCFLFCAPPSRTMC